VSTEERFGLPEAYSFVNRLGVTPEAVIALRSAANWGTEQSPDVWQSTIFQSLATVGVVDAKSDLVGVGFLAGNNRHAVLCDLVVHPDHRRQHIGQAILHKRLEIADDIGIPYLYTELSHMNTVRGLYVELGFRALDNLYVRAARRHPDELQQ
jgi:ribosomal protein S18 acetylase RimI-like enzyme